MDLTFTEKSEVNGLELDFWCFILLILKLSGDYTLTKLVISASSLS